MHEINHYMIICNSANWSLLIDSNNNLTKHTWLFCIYDIHPYLYIATSPCLFNWYLYMYTTFTSHERTNYPMFDTTGRQLSTWTQVLLVESDAVAIEPLNYTPLSTHPSVHTPQYTPLSSQDQHGAHNHGRLGQSHTQERHPCANLQSNQRTCWEAPFSRTNSYMLSFHNMTVESDPGCNPLCQFPSCLQNNHWGLAMSLASIICHTHHPLWTVGCVGITTAPTSRKENVTHTNK